MLVTAIYNHQEVSPVNLNTFCDIMSYALTEDPSKDVKIISLNFWEKLVNNYLIVQGMVDGEFPEMTFSKETRKIVVLDDEEIARRLSKVLEELSENGCLAALSAALDDVEVQDAVVKTMETFIHQLKKSNILENVYNSQRANVENSNLSYFEDENIFDKILGRKKISPDIFLHVLNRYLVLKKEDKPDSVSKQLELFLESILNQSCSQHTES